MAKPINPLPTVRRRRAGGGRARQQRLPRSFERLESRTVLSAAVPALPPIHDIGSIEPPMEAHVNEIGRLEPLRPQFGIVRVVTLTHDSATVRTMLQMFSPTLHRSSFAASPISNSQNGLRLQDSMSQVPDAYSPPSPTSPASPGDYSRPVEQNLDVLRPPLRAQVGPTLSSQSDSGIAGAVPPASRDNQRHKSSPTLSSIESWTNFSALDDVEPIQANAPLALLNASVRDSAIQEGGLQGLRSRKSSTDASDGVGGLDEGLLDTTSSDEIEFSRLCDLSLGSRDDALLRRLANNVRDFDGVVQQIAELRGEQSQSDAVAHRSQIVSGVAAIDAAITSQSGTGDSTGRAVNGLLRRGMILLWTNGDGKVANCPLELADDESASAAVSATIDVNIGMYQAFDIAGGDGLPNERQPLNAERIPRSAEANDEKPTEESSRLSKGQAASVLVTVAAGAVLWHERKSRSASLRAEENQRELDE